MNRRHALQVAGTWMAATAVGMPAGAAGQAPSTSSDDAAVARRIVAAYVAAREARDRAAIAALLTPAADQLVSSGQWRRGREGVVAGALESSSRNPGSRVIEVAHTRRIAADVLLVDGRYAITGTSSRTTRRMWSTFVLTRESDGDWRIAAIRNMLPAEG